MRNAQIELLRSIARSHGSKVQRDIEGWIDAFVVSLHSTSLVAVDEIKRHGKDATIAAKEHAKRNLYYNVFAPLVDINMRPSGVFLGPARIDPFEA